MGALSDRIVSLMPARKFPVRRTFTHWTTGGLPITVQAIRVVPVLPVSEPALVAFTETILIAPGLFRLLALARARATHAGLEAQPWSFSMIPFASPLVSSSISAC